MKLKNFKAQTRRFKLGDSQDSEEKAGDSDDEHNEGDSSDQKVFAIFEREI
jgi:hypothetical protein